MFIEKKNFSPVPNARLDGKKLFVKYQLPCVKNLVGYKIFSDKVWNGNGFGTTSTYYILSIPDGTVYRFNSIRSFKLSEIADYLSHNKLQAEREV